MVLTDEKTFMSYYPYWGFNAFTSHYANPLGEFSTRNEQIETWANDSWDMQPRSSARPWILLPGAARMS